MKLGCREANHQFFEGDWAVGTNKEGVLTECDLPIAVIQPIKEKDVTDVTLQAMVDEVLRPASRKDPTPDAAKRRRWRREVLQLVGRHQCVIHQYCR